MNRLMLFFFKVLLLLSLVNALLMGVRMLLGLSLGIGSWHWGGAMAAFAAPALLALATYTHQRALAGTAEASHA